MHQALLFNFAYEQSSTENCELKLRVVYEVSE